MTNVKQFGIIQIEKWKPKTVATMIHKQYYETKSQTCEPYPVAADGSLFLFIGLKVYVDCEQKSNNTTHTSNNSQSVHVSASFRDIFPA